MKQLYSVATYYQLISAIQLRTKVFSHMDADLIISDHSNHYADTVEKLRSLHLFGHVYTARIVEEQTVDTFSKKARRVMRILTNNNRIVHELSDLDQLNYDEFLFFNIHYFNTCLCYLLKKQNPALVCRRFEEGYTSGFAPDIFMTGSAKLQERIHGLYRNPSMLDVEDMYFYEPDLVLFHNSWECKPLPKLDQSDAATQRIMHGLFGDIDISEYDRKYIFFEESYFRDGKPIDDLELVLKIADCVGKENLMVKLHPRTQYDRFAEHGIKTNKTVGVPWEAIVMSGHFENNVFMTIASGSVLSPRILLGKNVTTYMLYRCTKIPSPIVTGAFHDLLEKFKNKYGASGFYVPRDVEELLKLLKEE